MMSREKPVLTKSYLKPFKQKKWSLYDEHKARIESLGHYVHLFESSIFTPHARISGRIDYWPASTRFFDREAKLWGHGIDSLLEYLNAAEIPKVTSLE